MTPKLKALSLIESMSFSKSRQMNYANGEMVDIPQNLYAKQCAIRAVDEIMKAIGWDEMELGVDRDNYWTEVKQEIEKI
jgi:hypothetical protein